jgi:hypothetical protein
MTDYAKENNKILKEEVLPMINGGVDLQKKYAGLFDKMGSDLEGLVSLQKALEGGLAKFVDDNSKQLRYSIDRLMSAHEQTLKAGNWPWTGKVITLLVIINLLMVASFVGFENIDAIRAIILG